MNTAKCFRFATRAASALAVVVLLGCASEGGIARHRSDPGLEYAPYAGAPIDSFITFGLHGWEVAGRDKLVIWNGVNEAYLVTLGGICSELQWVQRVAVTSTTHRVSKFERVHVGRDSCPIDEIRPLDIKRLKADRAKARLNTDPHKTG
jgi:hypothetical protein